MTRRPGEPADPQRADPMGDEPTMADEKTSELLRRVLAEIPDEEVRIGQLVRRLRRRSFGGLLILLAALGLIPGISTFAGLAMLVPGAQMALGLRAPLLPRIVRQRVISRERLRQLGEAAIPWLERVERVVRPRWLALTVAPAPSLLGVLVIGLALVVILPLPFSNFPPAVALICLSLGLLERDGVLVAIGVAVGAVALAIGVVIAVAAVSALMLLLG